MASTLAADDSPTVALLGQMIKRSASEMLSEPVNLPLLGWVVKADVVASISHVTLNQSFHNIHDYEMEITYCFPLIEGSMVCGFKMQYENGTEIHGIVKEREQAIKEFNLAKQCRRRAGLLERDRPDVFKLSLGCLGSGEYVRIEVMYMSILKIEDDAVCFVFPTRIAPLYCPSNSSEPASVNSSASMFSFQGQHVEVSFRAMTPITSLWSPSHDKEVSINISGSSAQAKMANVSKGSDIILLCKEEGSNEPRALLEIGPDDSVVGLVMLCPKVAPVEARGHEFVFIVDRSGSMDGEKIDQAREALKLFQRGLPVGSALDIVSFGSSFTSLFGESRSYDDDALETANQHASEIQADMGGTEILSPLRHALGKPLPGGRVRNVFLLTDGQVSNADEIFAVVEAAASAGESAGRCRVFALGVGDTVSHHLVNGVARAGGGTARFVRAGQDMRGPALEQLKQAMNPALERVTVTWNFEDSEPLAGPTSPAAPPAGESDTRAGVPWAQADGGGPAVGRVQHLVPSRPRAVFGGERFLSFAIFEPAPGGGPLPLSVTVTALWAASSAPLSIMVRLTEGGVCRGVAVHKLAAREAIRALEEGGAGAGAGGRAAIERLATAQGLVSSATALVAVDAATARAVSTGTTRTEAGQPVAGDSGLVGRWRTYEYQCNSNLVLASSPYSFDRAMPARKRDRSETGEAGGASTEGFFDAASASATRVRTADAGRDSESDGAARLCLLQRADGQFLATAALYAAVGLAPGASAALRAAAAARCGVFGGGGAACEGGDEDAVWATAMAVAAVRTRFPRARAVWELMEGKALAALARLCGGADWGGGSAVVEEGVAVVCALLRGD